MMNERARMHILDRIEVGEISVSEAIQLIQTLEDAPASSQSGQVSDPSEEPPGQGVPTPPDETPSVEASQTTSFSREQSNAQAQSQSTDPGEGGAFELEPKQTEQSRIGSSSPEAERRWWTFPYKIKSLLRRKS
jgi:hypothetical protein